MNSGLAQGKAPMGSMKTLRDRGVVQAGVAAAEAKWRAARAFLVDTLQQAWTLGLPPDLPLLVF